MVADAKTASSSFLFPLLDWWITTGDGDVLLRLLRLTSSGPNRMMTGDLDRALLGVNGGEGGGGGMNSEFDDLLS